ncbi:DUF4157 domain-containing protein [Streptomyces fuscichromogenes]|uniref:eCIS core domain-containing protein n=1 Tax=Streptomyces fuscichromogenes TaxID=1324013 RepID=UPI00381ABC0B
MRWLPRRRRRETRDVPADQGLPPGDGNWRRLPPLVPTVRRPPLTAAASMGVVAADRTRRATRRDPETPGRPTSSLPGAPFAVEPAAGRVTGLVAVRAEGPSGQAPVAPPPARGRRAPVTDRVPVPHTPPAPVRLTPRVLASAGPRPSLVEAADEYVGDPLPDGTPGGTSGETPEEPYEETPYGSSAPVPDDAPKASSDWVRMLESYRPPWATEGGAASSQQPGAVPPVPEGGASWSSEATVPPPRPARGPGTGAPKTPARRASLAESRRLGLGNPLRRPPGSDVRMPVDQPADALDAPETQDRQPERTPATETTAPPEPGIGADTDTTAAAGAGAGAEADADAGAGADTDTAGADADTGAGADADRLSHLAGAGPSPRSAPDVATRTWRSTAVPEAPLLGLGDPVDGPARLPHATSPGARPPRRPTPPVPTEPAPHTRTPVDGEAVDVPGRADGEADARPAASPAVTPVYRSVPGERPAPPAAGASRPTGAVPTPTPTPTAAPATSTGRPLVRPRARRRPDGGRPESEPRPSAPVSPPVRTAPSELADAVRRVHGVDVSDVPIHRGPEAAAEARSLGARAFTRNGEVFLPAHEGPFDQPVARGLLAHELTHAAQQRALGPALPPEDSDAGTALEAAAVATERWARGSGADPLTADVAPAASWTAPWIAPGGGAGVGAGTEAGTGPGAVAPPASWAAPRSAAPASGVQRQPGDVTTMAEPMVTEPVHPPPTIAPTADVTPSESRASQAPAALDAELLSVRDRLIELSGRRPLDLDDPGDIEEVAGQVYEKIHRRLRRELLVDRERAGRLGETGPFGWAR